MHDLRVSFRSWACSIVAALPGSSFRRRDVNVLRILAAEMGAALENHRLHEDNRQLVRELLELHNVTAAALADLSLDRALEAFTDSAMKFSGLDACNFWLLSDDGTELVLKPAGQRRIRSRTIPVRTGFPWTRGLLGRAFTEKRASSPSTILPRRTIRPTGSAGCRSRDCGRCSPCRCKAESGRSAFFRSTKRHRLRFWSAKSPPSCCWPTMRPWPMNVCMLNEELKSQNRELAANISLMRGILASMSSGVMLLDRDGTVRLINQAGAELLHPVRTET